MNRAILSLIFLLALAPSALAQRSLLAEQALCAPVGVEQPQELCVLNIEIDPAFYTSQFYLVDERGIRAVEGLGGGFQIYELLVSPDSSGVAIVENGGEGHPFFYVANLEHIRAGKKPGTTNSIEAYPYGFFDLEWQGGGVLFKSETHLSATGEEIAGDGDRVYQYRLDLISSLIEKIDEVVVPQ